MSSGLHCFWWEIQSLSFYLLLFFPLSLWRIYFFLLLFKIFLFIIIFKQFDYGINSSLGDLCVYLI